MAKCYNVSVVFSGSVQYSIEAADEEDAKAQAEKLFDEESDANIVADIEDIHFGQIAEEEAI